MIAVMTLVAYALVLRAFQIAPISYAGAAREVGIVFGPWRDGSFWASGFGRIRTVGAVLVFAGIGVLALAGDLPIVDGPTPTSHRPAVFRPAHRALAQHAGVVSCIMRL